MNASSVTVIVKWLALTVVSLDGALVAFILYRRAIRSQFYRRQDAVLGHFSEIVAAYLTDTLPSERTTVLLKIGGRPEREAAKKLLLGSIHANRGAVTKLLIALGFVDEWAEQAFGKQRTHELLGSMEAQSCIRRHNAPNRAAWRWIRRLRLFSVSRAVAIGHIGRLSPEFSGVFIREALRDPSPYVTRTCVASIGHNQIPEGVSVLLEELRKAVNGETELPIRSIKTALVRYPVTELRHFTAFMDNSNPQFRFLAVDTIREICRKAAGYIVRNNRDIHRSCVRGSWKRPFATTQRMYAHAAPPSSVTSATLVRQRLCGSSYVMKANSFGFTRPRLCGPVLLRSCCRYVSNGSPMRNGGYVKPR